MHAQSMQSQQNPWNLPPMRQNTVDAMLDDLQIPDVRMDIPDDSFDFQGYPGLAAPSMRPAGSLRDLLGAGSMNNIGMPGEMDLFGHLPGVQPAEGNMMGANRSSMGANQHPNGRIVTSGNGLQQPFSSQSQLPNGQSLPELSQPASQVYSSPFASPLNQYPGMLNMPTGMPAISDEDVSGPHLGELDDLLPGDDHHAESQRGNDQFSLGPNHDTKTKRNAKQQMQNKQAQQRYRERRKQRFTEMEQQVKVLTSQIQDQAALRRQNQALMARLQEMEHAVLLRTTALEQAHEQLRARSATPGGQTAQADREDSNTSDQGEVTGEFDTYYMQPGTSINRAEQLIISRGRQQAKEAQLRGFAEIMTHRYNLLKDFIEQHHLRDVDPTDVEGPIKDIQMEVRHLVQVGSRACIAAEQTSGIKVLDLMTRNLQELTHMTCKDERRKWTTILQALKLTPAQSSTIAEMRKVLLHKLGTVYDERRQLHLQTMALMGSMSSCGGSKMTCLNAGTPVKSGDPDFPTQSAPVRADGLSLDDSLESRISGLSLSGYAHCARNDVSLDQMLDKIKDNLRMEQRIIFELNATIIHRVFTPIQAALFLVDIYPAYTDTLALANIVEYLRNGRKSTDPEPAKLEGNLSKEDKSEGSDQCSMDRTELNTQGLH